MANEDGAERVTLAVLQRDIQHLSGLVENHIRACMDGEREQELRLRDVEFQATRIAERQGIMAGGQAVFSLALSAIAGWLGMRS